ncbi:LacI family DNA-binding transcriptional regulator [Betaproteobacteria bacterium SCN2]|nr:LacI family DNA-binding transcriptional regulator [Betaproteobacteria bacterium SCN2]NBS02786.1 GntR family transcriptional regulator [Hyphomicrobiales bacterium]NCW86606.1 GntR family transcriptional regulator [Oxalobacteraceae bacterium]NDG06089.1 GntR family transcriptional regulator [Oxalobacteraceae bacterium]
MRTPEKVSKPAIEKVKQAVIATGYIPNMLAGGLKSRRSMTVVGLVPIISVPQFLPTVRVMTETLDTSGYQLILGQTGYDHAREEKLISSLMGRRPDGVVVAGQVHSPKARELLKNLGVPVVETWDLSEHPIDMIVGFSHIKVGNAVAGFFLSRGWKNVALATGDDERAQQRRQGFMATFGHDVPTVTIPAPSNLASGRRALSEILEKEPGIEAIFCSSDGLAQGVLVEALARGLRVPQDLALCGFGDADFAAHLVPSLTTVHVDGAGIGRMAAELILSRCAGKEVPQKINDIGFRIVERESTALRSE